MSIIDRLATSYNVPHEDEHGGTIHNTTLGKIRAICGSNRCVLEDPKIKFSQTAWDMIVYFQIGRNDTTFGWRYNKLMKEVISDISDEDRELCLQELTQKAAIKRTSLLENFGQLYLANKEHWNDDWVFCYDWNLIHHFDGTCRRKTNVPPSRPTVTILGDVTPEVASIFLNLKPYIPACHRDEPCGGCEEVERLLSIYTCNDIHHGLTELKHNLRKSGKFSNELIEVTSSSDGRERAIKDFSALIPLKFKILKIFETFRTNYMFDFSIEKSLSFIRL